MKESAEIWNDAAKCLEFQQNFSSAAACYERARKFGDESSETLLNLAVSYIQLYNFYSEDKYLAKAKEFLVSGTEKEERSAKLHHYLGIVYLALDERELAFQEFFREEELKAEEGSEFIYRFELPVEMPVYEAPRQDVYELFPDPALYKIFDLVKGFPLDSALFDTLKDTYGERDSASLLALYLRSIYYKVFEDKKFASELGLSTAQAKSEALLVFFVRGINSGSKALVKGALGKGTLDISKLPAYTRLLIERYRREILSSTSDREGFRALVHLPLAKLGALNEACEVSSRANEEAGGKRRMMRILEILSKVGFAHRKAGAISISKNLLEDFESAERIGEKIAKRQSDSELFLLLSALFRQRRFEYALDLVKKIRGLYDESEAMAYIKDVLSSISLSEEEKFEILSAA